MHGSVKLYKVVSGKKVPVVGWDLSHVVAYLVPIDGDIALKPPAKHAVISQKGAKFVPDLIVISKGQTVDFPNDDNIDHNVFSFSKGNKFDLGVYPKGTSKSLKFEQEGPVLIFCSIHENMNGVIYVAPNPLFAVADATGTFDIRNVPIGKYKLRTWHTALPEAVESIFVRDVDVASGKPIEVAIDLTNIVASEGQTP